MIPGEHRDASQLGVDLILRVLADDWDTALALVRADPYRAAQALLIVAVSYGPIREREPGDYRRQVRLGALIADVNAACWEVTPP